MKMHKLTLLLALLAAVLAIISCSDAAGGGAIIRTQLTRADAGRGLNRRQQLRRMTLRSKARAARLLSLSGSSSSSSASASAVPGKGQPLGTEYLISFAIGTPPQPVQVTLDTGSDLVWTQCQPCPSCYAQALPYYDPNLSATSAELACDAPACQQLDLSSCGTHKWGNRTCVYTYFYGDKSVTNGRLDADTFTFDDDDGDATIVPGLAFGCGLFNNGLFSSNATGGGIAGFGRGALSLPSQLKVDNFSYCFTNMTGSTPSPVLLGLPANLYGDASGGAAVQTTPLIQSSANPTFYYLSLKGIRVGSTRLPVPESAFALNGNGSGGTIIDSGTSVTQLPPLVYGLLHDAFVSQVNLPVTNDEPLCFALPSSSSSRKKKQQKVPKLELLFEGATLDLPRENYVFEIEEDGQSNMCIAVVSSGGDLTFIGNYQQQNLHVLYDLAGNKLSFVPAHCDKV